MIVDDSKSFTVENNVYKGQIKHYTNNYKSLGDMIWTKMKSNGDKIAHLDVLTEKVVTYAELQDKVVRCALWLQKRGIKADDVITVCTINQINSIVPCLAALYNNAIFNPWNEDMDFNTAVYLLQMISPKVIFCTKKPMENILRAIKETNSDISVVVFDDHPDMLSFSDILNDCSDTEVANFKYVAIDDIKKTACIVHSSGTTGMPKGAELSHYGLLLVSEDDNITPGSISIWFSSLYWISGVFLNIKSIMDGTRVIIYPSFDEEMTCKLIEKYEITMVFLGTSMINRFLRAGHVRKYSLPSLKLIIGGGAILKAKAQEALKTTLPHVDILQGYGMTEIGGVATLQKSWHKVGSCGTVVPNTEMKVVDPTSGKVLGPNQPGELWIKSHTMMNGYYKNPEATKNTIDEDGWLHTGDIVYIDEDGELYVIDRIKELIKYRGFHISPGEIEGVLMSHPAVLEVAVVSVPHPTDDEHPVAYISKKSGAKETEQDLIDFVANNMTDQYKLRAGVIFVDVFPYTGSGKIARKDLKAMAKKLSVME